MAAYSGIFDFVASYPLVHKEGKGKANPEQSALFDREALPQSRYHTTLLPISFVIRSNLRPAGPGSGCAGGAGTFSPLCCIRRAFSFLISSKVLTRTSPASLALPAGSAGCALLGTDGASAFCFLGSFSGFALMGNSSGFCFSSSNLLWFFSARAPENVLMRTAGEGLVPELGSSALLHPSAWGLAGGSPRLWLALSRRISSSVFTWISPVGFAAFSVINKEEKYQHLRRVLQYPKPPKTVTVLQKTTFERSHDHTPGQSHSAEHSPPPFSHFSSEDSATQRALLHNTISLLGKEGVFPLQSLPVSVPVCSEGNPSLSFRDLGT